jgi:hypothetical protein
MTYALTSQQVSWWSVHTFVTPLLTSVGTWPMAGTPEWCALPDDDPVKWAALFDAARHHALRLDVNQAALAETSRDISGAADWPAIATEMVQRHGAYIPRRAAS